MSLLQKNTKQTTVKRWLFEGEHWIWLNSLALSVCLSMVLGLLAFIFVKGFAHFWPSEVVQFTIQKQSQQTQYLGEIVDTEKSLLQTDGQLKEIHRTLLKIGNRENNPLDFKWIDNAEIKARKIERGVAVIERHEWGNAYGKVIALETNKQRFDGQTPNFKQLLDDKIAKSIQKYKQIQNIEKKQIGFLNQRLEKLRTEKNKLTFLKQGNERQLSQELAQVATQKQRVERDYIALKQKLDKQREFLNNLGSLRLQMIDGRQKTIALSQVVRIYYPNDVSFLTKIQHYFTKMKEFITEDPREANTEGGIFPAIFGTVMLVLLMTVFVTPLGVIAAIYLKEYAKQGFLVRIIRISVNNLAGVPSIVYGVFGLGFFVYFMGGKIDDLFYSYNLPSPTFGSPNMLWASLTLALLTLPVVIVSTEEGLSRIPYSIREGSLALGATKFETIWRTVLPMASPAIMTGVILAISRATGEVAPLMLVGVVKLAPDLVIDGVAPFIHLDRQFMHLGFHIFDVGFQSPNVEAARPLVYATATLLVLIIIILNMGAIKMRNHLREKYKSLEN